MSCPGCCKVLCTAKQTWGCPTVQSRDSGQVSKGQEVCATAVTGRRVNSRHAGMLGRRRRGGLVELPLAARLDGVAFPPSRGSACRGGGTGRHSSLSRCWAKARASSSLVPGTIPARNQVERIAFARVNAYTNSHLDRELSRFQPPWGRRETGGPDFSRVECSRAVRTERSPSPPAQRRVQEIQKSSPGAVRERRGDPKGSPALHWFHVIWPPAAARGS